MLTLSAKDAKYGFGRLIVEPVAVAEHGRPVVVVMAVEEYERFLVANRDEANLLLRLPCSDSQSLSRSPPVRIPNRLLQYSGKPGRMAFSKRMFRYRSKLALL
ncbi:MAG: prevent-host-death family protein [Nitrosospira multiformis]|jgi:hypothetical protein|nr:prevent-host-death family protein [Nitrosospira multiformis]